jgi:hypothetical protein
MPFPFEHDDVTTLRREAHRYERATESSTDDRDLTPHGTRRARVPGSPELG